jgi:hypothetical protein
MVETLNQVNSVGTKCYDIIVVIVDAIRGIVENHEECVFFPSCPNFISDNSSH